jgi:hypothetical protein
MIKRLGNDKNYIEYNDKITYGTKKSYENKKKPNSFRVDGGEVGFEMNAVEFYKSAEFALISGNLTKLVENGEVKFERGSNPRNTVPYEVICDVIENSENLDKMVEDIEEKNNLNPRTTAAIKKEIEAEKND